MAQRYNENMARTQELQRAIREVAESFLARFPDQIELLDQFYSELCMKGASVDLSYANKEAHKIRGIALTLGFERVGHAAGVFEDLTEEDAWDTRVQNLDSIKRSLERLISEMETLVKQKN